MNARLVLLAFAGLLIFVQSASISNSFDFGRSESLDYFVFTQHWPAAFCMTVPESEECHVPTDEAWKVHGLWPDSFSGHDPSYCSKNKFNLHALAPIEDELTQAWPNLFGKSSVDSLWKHEWEKHGTCAAQLESMDSELKYFSAGLSLYKQYNIAGMLSADKIIPDADRSYTLSDVQNAVKGKTGILGLIHCFKKDGKFYLFQMEVCLDKQLSLIVCPHHGGRFGNEYGGVFISSEPCPEDQPLYYKDPGAEY